MRPVNKRLPNNSQPKRKDKIFDLTIISNSLQEKVTSWRVQKEVYLNTDHSLITFNIGVKLREDPVIRYDFKRLTEWSGRRVAQRHWRSG